MDAAEMIKLGIPAELHGDASLAEVKDPAALAKAYVETKRLVGGSIRIPTKDAGEEAQTAFRTKIREVLPDLVEVPADPAKLEAVEGLILEKLGKPKDAKAYPSLKDSKIEVPAAIKIDEDELRGVAHRLNFTKKQYLQFAGNVLAEKIKAATLESDARKALKTDLGDAFDDRLLAAAHAAQQHGASEATVTAIRTGNVPIETAKLWIGVAKSIGVKGGNFDPENGGSGKMSPSEAEEGIRALYANPALTDKSHPSNKDLVKKLGELHAIAYPDSKK